MGIGNVIEALEQVYGEFVAEHGCALQELDQAAARLGRPLPAALREMYARTGRHPLHSASNVLVPLSALQLLDGHLVIYREEQGISDWAIPETMLDLDDPPVFTSATTAQGPTFVEEFTSLSDFLCFQAAWQGVGGALPFVGTVLAPIEFAGGQRSSPRVRLTPDAVSRIGTQLAHTAAAEVWYRPAAIAVVQDDGYFGLAARTETGFTTLAQELGIALDDWDYATLSDEL